MATNQISLARARANIGIIPIILAALQTILLYVTTSSLFVVETVYGCNFFCATAAHVVTTIAAVMGALVFALPAVIGAFSRTWRGALVLAVLPWWITVIAHAGALLAPYIGLAGNEPGGRFDAPFWLSASQLPLLLASLALFAALGWLGWLARRALAGE